MQGEHLSLTHGHATIDYRLIRRPRKTLEIAVEPDASVVIAAPEDATLEAIEARLRKRASWVLRQQRYFAQFLPRVPARIYVAGETHLYLGRQYRLKIVPHVQQAVKLSRGYFVVQTHRPLSPEITREMLEAWYREHAQVKFAERIEANLARFPDQEERRPTCVMVRQLRQRWGSMTAGRRLLLNRRLIEAPISAIDYVITHELCHVTEPHHGPAFFKLLDRAMPDWEKRKLQLEKSMA